ncbi:hypothetical protein RJT34_25416 [Clitoria ternatea]|uniref:Uncharacterized protein n=1 Tax=Clitoria ternatea TaxID=43366 RepID=A0AAN9FXV4_CLITE
MSVCDISLIYRQFENIGWFLIQFSESRCDSLRLGPSSLLVSLSLSLSLTNDGCPHRRLTHSLVSGLAVSPDPSLARLTPIVSDLSSPTQHAVPHSLDSFSVRSSPSLGSLSSLCKFRVSSLFSVSRLCSHLFSVPVPSPTLFRCLLRRCLILLVKGGLENGRHRFEHSS